MPKKWMHASTVERRRRERFRAKHPELTEKYRVKHSHAKRIAKVHGMSAEDYDYFVRAQRGRCAICRRTAEEAKQRHLSIDHCHETGRARGLLCGRCNWTVGVIKEDPAIARSLLAYVENRCLPAKAAGVLE
jgi:Recombination endonuclease VII